MTKYKPCAEAKDITQFTRTSGYKQTSININHPHSWCRLSQKEQILLSTAPDPERTDKISKLLVRFLTATPRERSFIDVDGSTYID